MTSGETAAVTAADVSGADDRNLRRQTEVVVVVVVVKVSQLAVNQCSLLLRKLRGRLLLNLLRQAVRFRLRPVRSRLRPACRFLPRPARRYLLLSLRPARRFLRLMPARRLLLPTTSTKKKKKSRRKQVTYM